MIRSVAPELEKLQRRIGSPPLQDVIPSLHHVHYVVAETGGTAFAAEVQMRTGYRLASVHGSAEARVFRLELAGDPVGMLVREGEAGTDQKMDLLALTTTDLEPAKRVLAEQGVGSRIHPAGLISDPLPGLGLRLQYVVPRHWDWLGPERSDTFPPLPAALPAGRIGRIDHIALRIHAADVVRAVELLVRLAGYAYSECYPVPEEHAETIVLRARPGMPALVISYGSTARAVVRRYVEGHGPRVHHTAFATENVPAVFQVQRARHVPFTTETTIGSAERGILQVFTAPSAFSLEITEYVERFQGFRGFFDPGNVGQLMASTRRFNE